MIDGKKKQLAFMGSDHAGFKAKEELKDALNRDEFDVTDLGCFSEDPCDYPDIAREVGEKVQEHSGAKGILICGSGIGVSIAANKIHGVRAALATSVELAELSRKHNDANILAMGARTTDMDTIKKMTDKFLHTDFDAEERHLRRVDKMNNI